MSNYTQTTDFSVKDGLGATDPEKIILGADYDVEFSNIATAINSKIDAPGSPTTNHVLTYNGSAWASSAPATALPPKWRNGCKISNNTGDATHDIDVSAGSVRDVDDDGDITFASAITKRIDASWAAGTGNGGFPSGLTLTNDTYYHIHAIGKADGTADAGFDTDVAASNLLSDATGYVYYRRLGTIYYTSSAIVAFLQVADTFYWSTPPALDVDTSTLSTTDTDYAITVPPDVRVMALMNIAVSHASSVRRVYIHPTDTADGLTPGFTASPLATGNIAQESNIHQAWCITNTSRQITAVSNDTGTILRVSVIAWRDFLDD